MEQQKFKKGDLVKVLTGHIAFSSQLGEIDLRPELVGKSATINYSYAEQYGGDDVNTYSICFCDTKKSIAWKKDFELESLHIVT